MVVKELDPVQASHDYEQAGLLALEQMVFYLKQAFGKEAEKPRSLNAYGIRVFNGLRFEMDNFAVQLDHLLLHRYGFILIENRSEAADIDVNIWGQWVQHFMGIELKISSPVDQGERKLRFLQAFLERNTEKLRSKRKNGIQKHFEALGFDFFVAIPNQNKFTALPGAPVPQACRAALIPERIFDRMEVHRKQAQSHFGLSAE